MFTLPKLPYAFGALAPAISEETLRTHYSKHHQKYVDKTNKLSAEAALPDQNLEDLIRAAKWAGETALCQNAAQAWNHGFYWDSMSPASNKSPSADLAEAIAAAFGDVKSLREKFLEAAGAHFGSGWAWLIKERSGSVKIWLGHDAANPMTDETGGTPLFVCDLWEHAYYLDHKNERATYLKEWWDTLLNWDFASRQFDAGQDQGWRYPAPGRSASSAAKSERRPGDDARA